MTPAGLVVEKVRQNLRLGGSDAGLATDFARECQGVNARLEQLREILDSGQELQALLMAETPPSILDEASLLHSVAEEWNAVCMENGLEVAAELQFQAAQKLNLLYSKGISPSHKIYKDFRDAVMARDDVRAMEIARAIERLNPADSNAKAERERLEAKVFRARDAALGEALAAGATPLVLERLQSLEMLGQSALESESANHARGVEARTVVSRDFACRQLEEIYLPSLQEALASGSWRQSREALSRVDAICSEHNLVLNQEFQQIASTSRDLVQREFSAEQKKLQFQNVLHGLLKHINQIDTDIHNSSNLGLNQSREALSGLKKLWQSVEGFGMEVAPEVLQKVTKSANTLEERIKKHQQRILVLWSVGISAALIFTGLAGWWILGSHSANSIQKEIQSVIASCQPKAVETLLRSARERNLQNFSPALMASISEAESYLAAERERMDALLKNLSALEDQMKNGFSGMDVSRIQEDWSQFQKNLKTVAQENTAPIAPRINEIQRAIQTKVTQRSTEQFATLQKRVQIFEEKFATAIRKSKTMSELENALENARKEVLEWDSMLKNPDPSVTVPPDIQTRANNFDQFVGNQIAELNRAKKVLDDMGQATTLDDFVRSRAEFATTFKTVSLEDVHKARNAAAIPVSQDKMFAGLLMPWDKAAWLQFSQGGDAANLRPSQMSESELKIYGQLLNAVGKEPIYEYVVKGSKTTPDSKDRLVYSQNRLISEGSGYRKGKVFDTAFPSIPGKVTFTEKTFSEGNSFAKNDYASIEDKGLCPFSEMSTKMDLVKFINADGNPQFTAWELIDRATSASQIDPIYFAYIVQSVDAMTSVRPQAWGHHFAPSFSKIREAVASATAGQKITPSDWITSEKLKNQLAQFTMQATKLESEARFLKSLAEKCKASGLQFAGYLDSNLQPVVLPSVLSNELWGLAGDPKNPEPALVCVREASGNWKVHIRPLPYSPLFVFPQDRRLIFEQASKSANIQNWSNVQVPPFAEDLVNPHPRINIPILPTAN
jgi:hypothetical protein